MSKNAIQVPLMVGPLSGVVTGQSTAFMEACRAFPSAIAVDSAFSSVSKIITYPIRLIIGFFVSNTSVYFTSSRSFVGFYTRDLPLFLLAWASKRQLINHLHGNDFKQFRDSRGLLTSAIIDFFYQKITLSCAPSLSLTAQYDRYPNMKLRVVPNFFDTVIGAVPLKKSTVKRLEIVYLSNLIFSKGFTIAVSATDILVSHGVPAHLTICGEPIGDQDMSVSEIKDYLTLQEEKNHITIKGFVSGLEKAELLARSHLFVLPTSYATEASPISIIEAFAAGCQVITTQQGSIRELAEGFHADIVDATAEEIATAAKRYYIKNKKSEIALDNRSLASSRFSSHSYRKNIRGLFDAV